MTASWRRTFGLCFALVTSFSVFAAAQPGSTPKERAQDRREIKDDKKEIAKDRKELRDDKKDPDADKKELREDRKELREDKKELAEDKKELREDRKDAIEKWRKNRAERRKDHVKELRQKWGDRLAKPAVRAELKVHARRLARLSWARNVATDANKTDKITKIDELIARENARHQAAMDRLKTEGGQP